jgi:hopene-associated glycosyltransferase HpnB
VKEQWDINRTFVSTSLEDVTVLIPARNEVQVIDHTLCSVLDQGEGIQVVVVNDQSTDSTARILEDYSDRITVVNSTPLPPGWSGKLWALEQGRKLAATPLILLLDADIKTDPGLISGLRQHMLDRSKDLVSLMAVPPMFTFWEKMLMPAFVYYFKLLYPFSLANGKSKYVAAAAGGCVLIKTDVLEQIRGFASFGSELIDDCQLARKVKQAGYSTWLGLTHSIHSARPYKGLKEIWDMVARTAFTQLRHSTLLLLFCTVIMTLAYFVPLAGLWYTRTGIILGAVTLMVMGITFLPVLRYYHRSWLWALSMPFTALLYLGMTWTSAIRYWGGERVRWRGRIN